MAEGALFELEGEHHRKKDKAGGSRRREPREMRRRRRFGIPLSILDIETCEANCAGRAKYQRKSPACAPGVVERPQIDEHAGRYAKAHQIGQRVELGSEGTRDPEHPRQLSIEHVEDRRADDRGYGGLPVATECKPYGGSARAQAEKRQRTRQKIGHTSVVAKRGSGTDEIRPADFADARHQDGNSASTV